MNNTAIHIATLNDHRQVLTFLIEQGGDVLSKNDEEKNCLDHAEARGHQELLNYLEPIVLEAQIWKDKNCIAKIMLNKERATGKFHKIPIGVFREIIKYAWYINLQR